MRTASSGVRSTARRDISVDVSTSVTRGRCGPCCSTVPTGNTATRFCATASRISGQVNSSYRYLICMGVTLGEGAIMPHRDDHHGGVRPRTAVLTRGFDPSLSFGSARPAVFRSSTYVFASPEAAKRAFDIMAGRVQPATGERADLVYSRFSHPNAEIFEDQIVPLEAGAAEAVVFNSGMAAIMTAFFTFARPQSSIVYTTPLYGGTTGLIHSFLEPFGVRGVAVPSGDAGAIDAAIRS